MSEQRWDQQTVARRLEEAADTLARLPDQRAHGVYDLWPKLIGAAGRQVRPAAASPEAIDRMDEALGWLLWLEPEDRQLVWLRAKGLPWSGSPGAWQSAAPRHGSDGPRRCSRSWSVSRWSNRSVRTSKH